MMEESKRKAVMEKLNKKLPESFQDDVKVADEKTLRDKIVSISKSVEDLDEEKKNDAKLNALKEQLKDINGGYKDARKDLTDRLKYIILTLEERGKL
jgi:hypothetical protein